MAFFGILGRCLEFSLGGGNDRVGGRINRLVKISRLEMGTHDLTDYFTCRNIGQNPLQPHTDFDPDLPLGLGNNQQDTIILALLAKLPRFGHPDRKLVDIVTLERRYRQHDNLVAAVALESGQLLVDPGCRSR